MLTDTSRLILTSIDSMKKSMTALEASIERYSDKLEQHTEEIKRVWFCMIRLFHMNNEGQFIDQWCQIEGQGWTQVRNSVSEGNFAQQVEKNFSLKMKIKNIAAQLMFNPLTLLYMEETLVLQDSFLTLKNFLADPSQSIQHHHFQRHQLFPLGN